MTVQTLVKHTLVLVMPLLMAAQMSMIALYEPFNHIVSNHRMFDTATLLEMEVMIQGLTAHIMELSRSLDEQKVDFLW